MKSCDGLIHFSLAVWLDTFALLKSLLFLKSEVTAQVPEGAKGNVILALPTQATLWGVSLNYHWS